jgi:hypothetical protein
MVSHNLALPVGLRLGAPILAQIRCFEKKKPPVISLCMNESRGILSKSMGEGGIVEQLATALIERAMRSEMTRHHFLKSIL